RPPRSCAGRPLRCSGQRWAANGRCARPRPSRSAWTAPPPSRFWLLLLLLLRLALLASFLVDRRGSPTLRLLRRDAALLVRLLDVLVLPLSLLARPCGHATPPWSGRPRSSRSRSSFRLVPVRPGRKPRASPAARALLP